MAFRWLCALAYAGGVACYLPLLIGQGLAWGLTTPRHTGGLLLTLAALTAAGGLITLAARGSS